jgi:hypothetical protein
VLWTIFSLVSGGIFFQEFAKTAVLNITMLFAGIGVVLWGVVLLAGTREPYDQVEWDEDDDGTKHNMALHSFIFFFLIPPPPPPPFPPFFIVWQKRKLRCGLRGSG